jgi:hypothetical protein
MAEASLTDQTASSGFVAFFPIEMSFLPAADSISAVETGQGG